jgi:hypothetical protein
MQYDVNIEVYKQRNRSVGAKLTRHRLRWRGKGGNGEKISNGGFAYINEGDLIHALKVQWPDGHNDHVGIRMLDSKEFVPLASVPDPKA